MEAIITGDIVSSQNIEPVHREQLFKKLDVFLKSLKNNYLSSYETFRGDSLQCKTIVPELALRTAILIRAFFRAYIPENTKSVINKKNKKGYFSTKYDIRLAIGIGEVDFIDEKKISSSDGQAFRLSGEGLDSLKNTSQHLLVKTADHNFDEQIEPAVLLVDALIQKWTQNQAILVLYKLQQMKEDEIAAQLQISQSAVTQRKKTAEWYAVEKLVTYFEKTIHNWQK
ncbi:hypothetical protein [Segetibacter koreensis]|uniref:hypothetical protein n=1 Tax=Segetibacter koreensis TaxID=398037 RepID=UPI00036A70AA|nr:hypothetical protein [Segetibacter koreensis]